MISSKKIIPRKWIKLIFSIFISFSMVVFLFNFIIDPYGDQNIFCSKKFKPVLNERGKKYNDIFYANEIKNYDSIIVGSSRVMKMVPTNFKETRSTYNFGVHAANNVERLFIIKEWLKIKKLKKVYFGIDYYNFNKNKGALHLDIAKFKNHNTTNYLSLFTLKLSYKSLMNQLKNTPKTFFNKDGSINYFNKDKLIRENKFNFSATQFALEAQNKIESNSLNHDFMIEEKVFQTLKEVKKLSDEYNFELIVFITPMQEHYRKAIRKYPKTIDKFMYIDNKLVDIFTEVYNFNVTSKYNKNIENFYDITHYRALLGDKILQTLNNHCFDYAEKLTKENKHAI